ncbi:MAG: lipoprotein [Beijerinckiaceae bacterium]|nr:lipoprotein [Beijerinckiaceae bacterium]
MLLLAAACLLGGCGRRGPLEPPPGSPAAQSQTKSTPVAKPRPTVNGDPITPNRPFALDPLL